MDHDDDKDLSTSSISCAIEQVISRDTLYPKVSSFSKSVKLELREFKLVENAVNPKTTAMELEARMDADIIEFLRVCTMML
jgi:hypothetical protein